MLHKVRGLSVVHADERQEDREVIWQQEEDERSRGGVDANIADRVGCTIFWHRSVHQRDLSHVHT